MKSRSSLLLAWLIGLALSAAMPTVALAWGSEGHQVIATLAERQLTPAAKKQIDRILSLEPGETLATISTWADEHRNPSTGHWHYINFPRGNCVYAPQRDCPDGRCVVEAIQKQQEILASEASDEQRLRALKYLVHFMGDIHQPLHAGYRDDKGGNTYQLQAFMRGSNLHALWDKGLIRNLDQDPETISDRLLANRPNVNAMGITVPQMAEESCRIVEMPDFYPVRKVGLEYVDKFTPVMEQRLTISGARLAAMLNQTLR